MQDYFSNAPEFIEEDNRKHRVKAPVNMEYMTKKHRALFPSEEVKNKTVLDVGCCMGATGYWFLAAGGAHYTGVEMQHTYAAKAGELLSAHFTPAQYKIVEAPIETYLSENADKKFDIVSALGVIYGFTDYYTFLSRVSHMANESVVIEGLYHHKEKLGLDFCGVQFVDIQTMNLADENASVVGRGTRISPNGLAWIMKEFGFGESELLKPEPIINTVDVYNVNRKTMDLVRYMMRFTRTNERHESLSSSMRHNRTENKVAW